MRRQALGAGYAAGGGTAEAAAERRREADPERRGYVVYRGVCTEGGAVAGAALGGVGSGAAGNQGESSWHDEWGLESFQTWGSGLRFASVPLAGPERVRKA